MNPFLKQSNFRTDSGLTLMELLVVIAILGLLATLAVPRVTQFLAGAKSDTAALQIDNLENAVEFFFIDMERYPTEAEGLQVLLTAPQSADADKWNGPYLDEQAALTDPWGGSYRYLQKPSGLSPFTVMSFGSDKSAGGSGDAADITS